MIWTTRGFAKILCATLALSATLFATASQAASITYPNQGPVPPGYMFTNISESSITDGLPLYGAPLPFSVGMNFSPTPGFMASANGGSIDNTDGQLNFTVMGAPGIPAVSLFENGRYNLFGSGTAATTAAAGASLKLTVVEINGVGVAPITLAPSNASATFNLLANPGVNVPWSLGLTVNVAGQLLGLGYGPGDRATKVEVVIDNSLLATSEVLSGSTITKDHFDVRIPDVPEPSSIALVGIGLCGLAARRGASRSMAV